VTQVLAPVASLPPLVDDGDRSALAQAARASLAYLDRLPAEQPVAFGAGRVTVAEMRTGMRSLLALLDAAPDPEALATELGRSFTVYRASPPGGVLFTGYYVPALPARATRDARFRFPVLGRPPDLVTIALERMGAPCGCREQLTGRVVAGRVEPYPTRAEIERGAAPRGPVLAWVDDPVALFFLQIQGSGTLVLPNGTRRRIGFAASNGHPYVSVGRLLIESGRLPRDQASMQDIRDWAAAHPEERDRTLQANPRYVFFRPLAGQPVGSLDVPVVGGRTIATDPALYPPGALAFIRVPDAPRPGDDTARGLARLVLNLDAGAAIRGPGRVDVFFGEGAEAEAIAGRLKSRGELYFLAPRPPAADATPPPDPR